MDERFEELKRRLFLDGIGAIEDFLGYEIDDEEYDVIENRLDMAYENMPDSQLNAFYEKYGVESAEFFMVRRLIKALQDDGITLTQISEELNYRERANVQDGHSGWDDNLIDYPTEELERIEAAWNKMEAKLPRGRVAIESTDDFAEPGFGARLVDDDVRNEDGTYGRVVEYYRIVHINENGRIEKMDDRVFDSADDAKEAVLNDSTLELVGYDDLVHEAGRSLGAVLAAAEAKASVVGTRDLGPGARGGMCK